ncbi:MAG: hypothetical protein CM15mP128_4500 [Methanobacteriota archaeon]|nr:MAG: hypothetical protein CM15mP128_4500 [Euryarchaeota archaeon]
MARWADAHVGPPFPLFSPGTPVQSVFPHPRPDYNLWSLHDAAAPEQMGIWTSGTQATSRARASARKALSGSRLWSTWSASSINWPTPHPSSLTSRAWEISRASSTTARLAATETNLGVGMNGDHAECFAPSSREHLAFSHAAKAVDHQQCRAVFHAVNGVGKANGEHVVTVLCTQFNGDSPKDTWVALEPLTHDLLSHHVAHGANGERERRGHVCEFPLAASGQATDGQHTDHGGPCRRGT